jgi:hypothetical protein
MQPMVDGKKNPDRAILDNKEPVWVDDPERTLTEVELDRLFGYFGEFENDTESDPRLVIDGLFRSFMGMAIKERFRESIGRLEQMSKPSTIVARQMKKLLKACENLDKQLAQLDPVTKPGWISI